MTDFLSRHFSMLVIAAAMLSGCQSPTKDDGRKAPAPVSITQVAQRTVPRTVRAIGTVESIHVVRLTPQVDGQLLSVHFTEGDHVEAGALLFRIDPRPFETLLQQREAALERDLADLRVAEAEAKRRAELFEQGFVSAEENEQAQARAASLRAAVAADRAAIEDARLQLSYCSIHAPTSGRIGQLLVHPGNVVRKNDTVLATLVQMHPIRVVFAVGEADLPQVLAQFAKGALIAQVHPDKGAQRPIEGKVEFIDNQVDRSTGTVLLKANFDNQTEVLWPGQFLPVELIVDVVPAALVVPRVAIQAGQSGPYVFALEGDHTVRVRPVTIAFEIAQEVVLKDGVRAGEWVVTEGQFRLTDGAAVEVKERQPAAHTPG
ncbi:MAG: efflux RND transporter periplasmic adaptor subunit [Candidatus Binatia bacterium]|nr:efflux RND transporter periplasmic adaptor subunit [Candidatus Binatia bacterium]